MTLPEISVAPLILLYGVKLFSGEGFRKSMVEGRVVIIGHVGKEEVGDMEEFLLRGHYSVYGSVE